MKVFTILLLFAMIPARSTKRRLLQEETELVEDSGVEAESDTPLNRYRIVKDNLTRQIQIEDISVTKQDIIIRKKQVVEPIDYPPIGDSNDIKDVRTLNLIIDDLDKAVKKKVFNDPPSDHMINKLERSYIFYQKINTIRERYFLNREEVEKKAERVREVLVFALDFLKKADVTELKEVNQNPEIELDDYNKQVAVKILEQMTKEADLLYFSVVKTLNLLFSEMQRIHESAALSSTQKVGKFIELSIDLTIWEKNHFEDHQQKLLELRRLLIDNSFYHHLSASFNKPLEIANSSYALGWGAVVLFAIQCFL